MLDFSAIAENNGWSIAFVGISIVFSGLVGLFLIISQLHKILVVWDKREKIGVKVKAAFKKGREQERDLAIYELPAEIRTSALQLKVLIEYMQEPASLSSLIDLAENRGLDIPHTTIHHLLQEGILIQDEDGKFLWNENN